jgi:aminopeptidase N
MNLIQRGIALIFCLLPVSVPAQSYNYNDPLLDVQHYRFELQLTDTSNLIRGTAFIDIRLNRDAKELTLDLIDMKSDGKGMKVEAVTLNGTETGFQQKADRIICTTDQLLKRNTTCRLMIRYQGVPADGLIISTNKYNKRTFFADNWPNRARHWLPVNDHPSDKATVEFVVTAPDHYQVISNGIQTEETNIGNGYTITHYKENVAIPTKVMVIGVAGFAVGYAGSSGCVEVSSWVFPEEKEKGFYDYAQAVDILPFYISNVAKYPFNKLANVQSKTIFGGMENAGCIFYHENSVNGQRKEEALISHEIAHQWFGNSVTEKHWSHLWLSEGFATYLTNCYLEQKYGTDTLHKLLKDQRNTVARYSLKEPVRPVVDSLEQQYMNLLNANSYQKGAWFLHMLRRKIGDADFWKSVAGYYASFEGKNATTQDFRRSCENASGLNLEAFFNQWLYLPGQPELEISYQLQKGNEVAVVVKQAQKELFDFPLEIEFIGDGSRIRKTFMIREREEKIQIRLQFRMSGIQVDPDTNVLATWKVKSVK